MYKARNFKKKKDELKSVLKTNSTLKNKRRESTGRRLSFSDEKGEALAKYYFIENTAESAACLLM